MVSFEIFVKAMPPSLWELKVLPSFCFAFKIPDDRAVTSIYVVGIWLWIDFFVLKKCTNQSILYTSVTFLVKQHVKAIILPRKMAMD